MQDSQKPPKKLIKTIKDIEKAIILMKKHKVTQIDIEGIKISIGEFDAPKAQPIKDDSKPKPKEGDDEILFWSTQQ